MRVRLINTILICSLVSARVSEMCEIFSGQSNNGTVFSEFFGFTLTYHSTVDFHTHIGYITWGMSNRPVGGHSSESVSPHRHEHGQPSRSGWTLGKQVTRQCLAFDNTKMDLTKTACERMLKMGNINTNLKVTAWQRVFRTWIILRVLVETACEGI
jgi:hypothetical protein